MNRTKKEPLKKWNRGTRPERSRNPVGFDQNMTKTKIKMIKRERESVAMMSEEVRELLEIGGRIFDDAIKKRNDDRDKIERLEKQLEEAMTELKVYKMLVEELRKEVRRSRIIQN